MLTVIFYCSILLSSTLFVYLSEKGKGKLEYYFFLTIAFFILFIPSAIRYDIGTDYLSYQNLYLNFQYYPEIEPAFYYINCFLNNLGLGPQWMFAVMAFIFTSSAFFSYPKKNAWIFHFILVCVMWYSSFNIMRQIIGLSLCLVAINVFFDRKFFRFLIFSTLGFLFHVSIILIIITGFLASISLSNFMKKVLLPNVFIGIILFTYISFELIIVYVESSMNWIGYEKYMGYFNNSDHFIERNDGSGLGVLIKVLFTCYAIFKTNIFINKNEKYWIVTILNFCYGIAILLANNIVIFGRLADIFSIAMIFSLFLLYSLDFRNLITKIVVIMFCIYMVLTFVILGLGKPNSYADPKRNPYVTIFNR